jgi:hypothetical protein
MKRMYCSNKQCTSFDRTSPTVFCGPEVWISLPTGLGQAEFLAKVDLSSLERVLEAPECHDVSLFSK